MRPKYYLGLKEGSREIFRSAAEPTRETHGEIYLATVGPFRTKRGAIFMRDYGRNNPHCQTVAQAEKIAAGYMYDLVLRKWIKKRVDKPATSAIVSA